MKEHIKKLLREGLLDYKRKAENDMWEFIDKDEFDKNSNKDNIIKYKK